MAVTKWDEYFIHQIQNTLDKVDNEDSHAFERTFIGCHNLDGTLNLMVAAAVYPNRKVMDAFVAVRYKGIQRNIGLSRRLDADRAELEIGPFSIKVVEPLKRLSIFLDDNDYGIACDLEFNARSAAWPRALVKDLSSGGVGAAGQAAYDQSGRCTGTITVEGKRINASGFVGGRDRSWGIRRFAETGTFGMKEVFSLEFWVIAHFSGFSIILGPYIEVPGMSLGNHGAILNDDGTVIPIVDIHHRVEFVPDFRSFSRVDLLLKDAGGGKRHLTFTPISRECYLSGVGYDDRHGLDRGFFHVEGEQWDVSRPIGTNHKLFGINHRIAEFDLEGQTGVGYVENAFSAEEGWQYKPTW